MLLIDIDFRCKIIIRTIREGEFSMPTKIKSIELHGILTVDTTTTKHIAEMQRTHHT